MTEYRRNTLVIILITLIAAVVGGMLCNRSTMICRWDENNTTKLFSEQGRPVIETGFFSGLQTVHTHHNIDVYTANPLQTEMAESYEVAENGRIIVHNPYLEYTPASCYEGEYIIRCSSCEVEISGILPAGAHTYGEWTTTEISMESDTVVKTRRCTVCGTVLDTVTESITESIKSSGAYGRLIIPSVGINVAIYDSNSQTICDAWDSACFWDDGWAYTIADHNYQGFEGIKYLSPGNVGYIIYPDGSIATLTVVTSMLGTKVCTYPDGSGSIEQDYLSHVFLQTCHGEQNYYCICTIS